MTPDKIIVALDVPVKEQALRLVDELRPAVSFFKVGLQLYTACGPPIVREMRQRGAKVFLDLKLHDIPNTVARAVEAALQLDVAMITVHLSGGEEMVRAAVTAGGGRMSILGVTVLTSFDSTALQSVGVGGDMREHVMQLARLGVSAGINGVVASPLETKMLRDEFGDRITIVVPGIRSSRDEHADQKRVLSPRVAIEAGADYLVIGRPITAASNRRQALDEILKEISR